MFQSLIDEAAKMSSALSRLASANDRAIEASRHFSSACESLAQSLIHVRPAVVKESAWRTIVMSVMKTVPVSNADLEFMPSRAGRTRKGFKIARKVAINEERRVRRLMGAKVREYMLSEEAKLFLRLMQDGNRK